MPKHKHKDKDDSFTSFSKDDSKKHKKKKHKHHSEEEETRLEKYKTRKCKYSLDNESSNDQRDKSKRHKKKKYRSKSRESSTTCKNSGLHEKEKYDSSSEDSGLNKSREYKKHRKEKRYSSSSSDSSSQDDISSKYDKEKISRHLYRNKIYADPGSSRQEAEKLVESFEDKIDTDFTFLRYKRDLNRIFSSFHIVQDTEEFWLFVKEYEKKEKRSKSSNSKVNFLGIPEVYDKSHRFNFNLSYRCKELFMRVEDIRELTQERLKRFKDIILTYLDFKQNMKFARLKQLRTEQANLPVAQFKDEIINAVKTERVVIIAGDTGCGKSTQVPQYLYTAGFGTIACTQPRRIACISLAKRVAYETLTENLNEVGYQIRFEKQKGEDTKITFITEGLLLRQVAGEAELSQYDVIVLDEVHERHLHGDFLLGIMKCLIHQRPDLKLVLMSATINIELFSNYFANEDVRLIQVPGRLYPIQLIYRPVLVEDKRSKNDRFNPSPYIQIMQIIDRKYDKKERGDLLIFLSGMSEITAVVEAAKEYSKKDNNWIVLPLHSTLSIADQDKVFGYPPEGVRKCIISTNIAETSITIDGIRFVADSGKVKEMSFDPICKMQRLKEFWISKASAEQRKGRAGRTGPGTCYRLYSAEDYQAFEKYSKPELQRVPLDSTLLQMIAMGLPDPRKFPFIEPPPAESIETSILSLKEHGALTENEKLTAIGKTLARLPVDISIGKMLIMGSLFHQIEPVLSLAAALSVQTPFTNRAYRDLDCEESRKNLESDHGDPITLLNAYKEWLEIKHSTSGNVRSGSSNSKKWCRRRGLEEQRFYEMTKLRTQFKDLLEDCHLLYTDDTNSEMTSSERTLRHGELKLLRSLKRSYKQNDLRKPKQLKLDDDNIRIEDEKEDEEIDIKDIEFRMKNDFSKVSDLVNASTACSYKDLMMLKLILCSGLYPQFASSDEFNYCKTVSEQLFHTKVKQFVALHPMSFFGNHPQVLQLEEPDITTIPGYKSKSPISAKHQILTYLSLLETTKPYLVNTMRMPAAQTLLLFAQEIDTNSTFTTIACDSWLSFDFPTPDSGALLLYQAAQLRQKWDHLLNLKLQDKSNMSSEDKKENIEEIEYELNKGLVEFMHTSVPYTVNRLLVAHLKNIYVRGDQNSTIINTNPFSTDFEVVPHEKKGGIRLTKQITYNCLIGNDLSDKIACQMLEIEWVCPTCGFRGALSSIEKLQHISICKKENTGDIGMKTSVMPVKKKNAVVYECTDCQKTLYLTPTEVLKHKKQHEK
ncbi:probable ATP-dependent RNA helicase DHX34 [Phymastichus coffea]|uniref:probable ATP-dependent RNA helicase DHX34 n=1 Tax=Phymastichus coffea TaxID=108790 RepID=UPI00273A9648|nr:probable ATP-dependent RNA helicase DHX34 [Phymastichus coffea]XP_058801680.1 probable ATP-dependent RNA helicase DHX34 [Phymastichus coffea]XP_058801681.1 probable ATP-dependent RNA helicase DHX34 [Phymastichus coffea]XP_058809592.1 probable ATP-dependent RNA helicase DHX34 [Phymastichus coffea]XP_058809593.1 probable ATP-dependent RNA helicase DHX34 [Phymastichus coffea]XP_058809594.1 probable ATP-dependent RNA helicase DHX34 [Phymastichus coffea]